MAFLEGAYEHLDKRLDTIQTDLRDMRCDFDQRFDRIDQRFNWLIGIMVTSVLTIIGVVVGFFESIVSHPVVR